MLACPPDMVKCMPELNAASFYPSPALTSIPRRRLACKASQLHSRVSREGNVGMQIWSLLHRITEAIDWEVTVAKEGEPEKKLERTLSERH